MANKRSTYLFSNEGDFQRAKDHIYRMMHDDYDDPNKIYFYGYWGACSDLEWPKCYRVDIYSNCTNPELAASIFREHRGRFYDC